MEIGSYGSNGQYYSPGERPEAEGRAHGWRDVVGLTTGYAAIVATPLFAPEALAAVGARLFPGQVAAQAARAATNSKVANYLLNPANADGAAKAAWFQRALGFTKSNAGALSRQLRFDSRAASLQRTTQWGRVYEQTSTVRGANGAQGQFTTIWQVDSARASAGAPRG